MTVHLHLLVLVFILLVPTPQQARGNVSRFSPMDDLPVPIDFKVVTDDYETFLGKLHEKLADTPTHRTVGTGSLSVPVLERQRKVPARLIHVKLVGTNADKTTIAVRGDNIYIVGFTNITGHWFEFERTAHLIPRSTVLPFGLRYRDFLGGDKAHKKLEDIKLGQENMLEAVHMLALHHPNHDNSYYDRLKVALARLCVMVAEAERFVPIKERVALEWKGTPQITATQANYVVLWGDISKALLIWQDRRPWEDKNKFREAKINSPKDALRILGLVLCPKKVC